MKKNESLAIEFIDIAKAFDNAPAVSNVSLKIESGQIFVLLGKNGAGKTTTLKMLAGLTIPDRGKIYVHGQDIEQDPVAAKRQIAYLPDEPLLYDLLKPMEYLEFIAGLWDMPRATAATEANELLLQLDLWDHRTKLIKTFSRGMRQKLALAGALLHHPSIFILDEPLTGLDAVAAKKIKNLLRTEVKKGGTILLTTHIMEVAEKLADKIAILDEGKITSVGPLNDLMTLTEQSNLEDIFMKTVKQL